MGGRGAQEAYMAQQRQNTRPQYMQVSFFFVTYILYVI